MKKKIAVLFGSRTVEHDVSIVTGVQLIENIDRSKYDVLPVYITREGRWFAGEKLADIRFVRDFKPEGKALKEVTEVYLPPVPGVGGFVTVPQAGGGLFSRAKSEVLPVDVIIPAMHGLHGEDGTLQGLLELCDIPYTSAGVLGSAAGMDKILMKAAFKGAGIPVIDGTFFARDEWAADRAAILKKVEAEVPYPMIVKPANLGSSIGINVAEDREALEKAIDVAVSYDRRIIVEHAILDNIEINCSCMGYSGDVTASVCEQPVSWKKFLDYDEKYLNGGKIGSGSEGMASLSRIIPAPIGDELTKEVQDLSVRIFKELDCKGVVRIDYLYDNAHQKLYANEINTIPGSFAFYLWEAAGVKYPELIDRLIGFAEKAYADKKHSNYAFESSILQKAARGGTKGAKGAKR